MRIRLIGIGEVGQQVAQVCCKHFQDRQISGLIERVKIVKPTTDPYVATYSGLRGVAQRYLGNAEARRTLRRTLSHLFFGGPDAERDQRWEELSGEPGEATEHAADFCRFVEQIRQQLQREAPVPAGQPAAPPAAAGAAAGRRGIIGGLLGGGAAPQPGAPVAPAQVKTGAEAWDDRLKGGFEQQGRELSEGAKLFGVDWLIVPEMPVIDGDWRPRLAGSGRELMRTILASQQQRVQDLLVGLGEVSCDVDVVAIAFSVGDAFGGSGAEELARAIRKILEKLNRNRVVAILGLAVYEGIDASLDGRYVGPYFRRDREANVFDGLVARKNLPDAIQGMAAILASIGMSSDPGIIQIDNPDANQLQRDFGKSLIACGHAVADPPAAGAPPAAPTLAQLYERAKRELVAAHTAPFPLGKILDQEVQTLKKVATFAQVETPPWLKRMTDATIQAGEIERYSGRKVIVYVGYDDSLQGQEIGKLRDLVAQDFPRARAVIYKYHVGNTRIFADRRRAGGPPAAGVAGVNASLRPHLALFVVDCLETLALERVRSYLLNHLVWRDPANGAVVNVAGGNQLIGRFANRLLSRALLSIPSRPDGMGSGEARGWTARRGRQRQSTTGRSKHRQPPPRLPERHRPRANG